MNYTRVERRTDAGGEHRFDASEKRSWREKLSDRLTKKSKDSPEQAVTKETAEKKVSFVGFFKEMFAERESAAEAPVHKTPSWIDEAFSAKESALTPEQENTEKIQQLDEHTRTEFLMIVAERFRAAGERFLSVLPKSGEAQTVQERAPTVEVPEELDSLPDEVEMAEVPEVSPPFDFAVEAALAGEPVISKPFGQESIRETPARTSESQSGQTPDKDPLSPQEYERLHTEAREADDEIIQSIIGKSRTKEVFESGDVRTYSYRARKRDVAIGAFTGGVHLKRAKRIERDVAVAEKRLRNLERQDDTKLETKTRTKIEEQVTEEVVKQNKQQQETVAARFEHEREAMQQSLKDALEAVQKNSDGVAAFVQKQKPSTVSPEAPMVARPPMQEVSELAFDELRATGVEKPEIMPDRTAAYYPAATSVPARAEDALSYIKDQPAPIPEKPAGIPQQIYQKYRPSAPDAGQNWASTLAILALIGISVVFISAI